MQLFDIHCEPCAFARANPKALKAYVLHAHIYLQIGQYRIRPDKPLTAPQSMQVAKPRDSQRMGFTDGYISAFD